MLNNKEEFVGYVAVAMETSGQSIEDINEVTSKMVGLLELGNRTKILRKANEILKDCTQMEVDFENEYDDIADYLDIPVS